MARPKLSTAMRSFLFILIGAGISAACAPSQPGPLHEGSFSRQFDATTFPGRADAIQLVIRAHPELRGFDSRSLPPSTIESAPILNGGWYVAFVQKGSGRPGILNARCFLVDRLGSVTSVGTIFVPLSEQVDEIDLSNCGRKTSHR